MALCKLDGIDAPAIYLGGLSAAREAGGIAAAGSSAVSSRRAMQGVGLPLLRRACRVRAVHLLDGAPRGVVLLLAAASWRRGDAPARRIQRVD